MQHLEITDDEDEHLIERVKLEQLRPLPPDTPDGFLDGLKPGAPAELTFDGGWWEVTSSLRIAYIYTCILTHSRTHSLAY